MQILRKLIKIPQRSQSNQYEATNCSICQKKLYQLLQQKAHLCKRCFRVVCHSCYSKNKYRVGNDKYEPKQRRLCRNCEQERSELIDVIYNNEIVWGQVSKIGKRWLENCKNKKDPNTYQQYLEMFKKTKDQYQSDIEMINKDVIMGRTDIVVLNYYYQDYFSKIIPRQISQEKITQSVVNVLYALTAKYRFAGYLQGMNFIANFLLTLLDEEGAFDIYSYLIEKILPDKLYQNNSIGECMQGFFVEQAIITHLSEQFFSENLIECTQQQITFLQTYLIMQLPAYIFSLLTNLIQTQSAIYVWDQMIMNCDFSIFEKAIFAIMKMNYPIILEQQLENTNALNISIMQNTSLSKLKQEMCQSKIVIDIQERFKIQENYLVQYQQSWNDSKADLIQTLCKLTKFQESEIKELQNAFKNCLNKQNSSEKQSELLQPSIGISQEQFIIFMENFNNEYGQFRQGYVVLNNQQYLQLFNLVAGSYKQIMDFRLFVCSLSLLIRGHIKDKLNLYFQLCSQKSSYIPKKDFCFYIDTLLLSLKYLVDEHKLQEKAQQFKEDLAKEYSQVDNIQINTLILIQSDEFINEIAKLQNIFQSNNGTRTPADYQTRQLIGQSCYQITKNLQKTINQDNELRSNLEKDELIKSIICENQMEIKEENESKIESSDNYEDIQQAQVQYQKEVIEYQENIVEQLKLKYKSQVVQHPEQIFVIIQFLQQEQMLLSKGKVFENIIVVKVNGQMPMFAFQENLKQKLYLKQEDHIQIFFGAKKNMVKINQTMQEIYENYKNIDDGFLEAECKALNSFGGFCTF